MIKLIAMLCAVSDPTFCQEKVVTESIGLDACQIAIRDLPEWASENVPGWTLKGWKCQMGDRPAKRDI